MSCKIKLFLTSPLLCHALGLSYSYQGPIPLLCDIIFECSLIFQRFLIETNMTFSQVSEKAVGYFERAALMQPQEPKWQLMVASCYRRSGNYHRALETYKMIHRRFPANIECLKFLVNNVFKLYYGY